MTILVAGAAEVFGISAAVAALLMGIVLSGPAAGALLSARGELSIAIAGHAAASRVAPRLEALAIRYVFVLAILGPDPGARGRPSRRRPRPGANPTPASAQ